MDSPHASPNPQDPHLLGFDELLHVEIPGPVEAIYDRAGSSIGEHRAIQATWRPGKSLTMRYRVSAEDGDLAGSNDVIAVIGEIPEGVSLVAGPEAEVGVWVLPDDPMLPGLRSALDVPTVSRLLADLGSTEAASAVRLRAYRPGRRAVVQVEAGSSSIFLKVVPPKRIEKLHAKHRFLADHLPVPDSLGLAPDLGIIAMRALPGVDLRTALRDGRMPLPDPSVIVALPASLPAPPEPSWRSWSPEDNLASTVDLLARLLPDEVPRLEMLLEAIGEDAGPRDHAAHGDYHEAQILVDGPTLIGLIDVDTFGWGRPGDDAATMLAHLHLMASGSRSPQRVIEFARALNQSWDTVVDPVRLRLKTAAHVLGLATGPFRVQSPAWQAETVARIEVAGQWVDSAAKVDDRNLAPASGSSRDDLSG